MYCPKCGTPNDDQTNFCKSCGAGLKPEVIVTANEPIPATIVPPVSAVEYAGFWRRVAAYIIDWIIWTALYSILMFIVGIDRFFNVTAAFGVPFFLSVVSMVIVWLYFALMESSSQQATLGKMAMGIKVTNLNGGRISFANATGRFFARIISAMILYIGFFMIAFTARKQGLHDIIANTLVVQK